MPFTLVPPGGRVQWKAGRRFANPNYLVRGTLDGREYFKSTLTRDPLLAQARMGEIVAGLRARRVPGPGEAVSYSRATEAYIDWRGPSEPERKRLRRLARVIDPAGDKHVGDVILAELVAAAATLYPDHKNETRNRWGIRLAGAVLHYAHKNRWRDWLRVEKLPEAPEKNRVAPIETGRAILDAIEAELAAVRPKRLMLANRRADIDEPAIERAERRWRKRRLLVVWLYKHGHRISDLLRMDWTADLDLPNRRYRILVGKRKRIREKPMDPEVFELLANEPEPRVGRIFPWRDRSGVYQWLRPLTRKLGVRFTPHMARHWLGTELNALGAGQKTIAGVLDHAYVGSSARYQDADFDIQRASAARLRRMR
jgi:hypothetical protein